MTGIQGLIRKMDADQATGYNLAGYEKLAHQMKLTDGIAGDMTHAIEGSVDGFQKARYGAESYDQAVGQVNSAEQKAQQEIRNLSGNLSDLENRYHGSQQQAYELIQATGATRRPRRRWGCAGRGRQGRCHGDAEDPGLRARERARAGPGRPDEL